MRTKTLLLTAALAVAGSATSMAQVYSVNVVGYVNVDLVAGYTMLANQLNTSANNSLESIFGNSLGTGDTIFKYNGASFDSALSLGDGSFIYSTASPFGLDPGEGSFVQVADAKTVTLVGEVPQGTGLSVSMGAGYSIVSSIVPQSVALETIGFPADAGDTVFLFNTGTQGFDSYISLGAGSGWLGSNPSLPPSPTPAVGESFFVQRAAAATWTRDFTVN